MPRVKLFDEKLVLEKAMNLFWQQGYAATSINDLVSNLGINRASIYDTFGDKEKLFKKSFELYRKTNIEGLNDFFKNRTNVKNGFLELFENAINETLNDTNHKGCFVVNTTTELIPNDESLKNIIAKNKNDVENIFYNYLKKGREKGQLQNNQNLKALASLLFMLYAGIKVVSKVNPQEKEMKDSIALAMSLLN
ncbi:TetR/AcrR family transcriptional regulator [Polaribacter sp. Hel_I_88]|uniref:TetR/AcrR family transcriptional regulator n=1 Tax=Polaribacter sp. Hel_I_88 TaxID=1250006 RepID=UPI00047BADBB|nr:TetR/AcrR family transcriptional regulator [Polaribacter sp. Hel_I_88]